MPVDKGLTETVQHQGSQNAGLQNAAPVLHPVGVQLPAPGSEQSCGGFRNISFASVSGSQPGGSCDTSVDTVGTKPHMEVLTQHVEGRPAVPAASAAAEVKRLMESGSGIRYISKGLVETLLGQPGMTQTALRQAFVGHACLVTSLGQECDIETASCPLHVTMETPRGPFQFTVSFIVLPLGEGTWLSSGRKRGKRNSAPTSRRSSRHLH